MPTDQFRLPDTVFAQPVDDELVFFHAERGQYLFLDAVGARVHALLLAHGLEAACARLLEEYDVDRDTLQADVGALLEQMLAAGVIERCAG